MVRGIVGVVEWLETLLLPCWRVLDEWRQHLGLNLVRFLLLLLGFAGIAGSRLSLGGLLLLELGQLLCLLTLLFEFFLRLDLDVDGGRSRSQVRDIGALLWGIPGN